MLLDHASMCFVVFIVVAPAMMLTMFQDFTSKEPPRLAATDPLTMYLFPLAFAIYFAKDSIDGRSIAKRIIKLQVVTASTGVTAGPIRCCLRNLSIVIWPLEVFITLFSNSRRLGDCLAGTRIVSYSEQKEKQPIRWAELVAALIIGYVFAFLLVSAMGTYLFRPLQN